MLYEDTVAQDSREYSQGKVVLLTKVLADDVLDDCREIVLGTRGGLSLSKAKVGTAPPFSCWCWNSCVLNVVRC